MAQRVLVVDDDRSIRHTLEGLLTEWGYEVETAGDGRDALAKLGRGVFDACLLDMGMPELDGRGVLEALQHERSSPRERVPIVVVSARDDMSSTVEAVKLGAYDFLLKPVDLDRLRLTLTRALEQAATNRVLSYFIAGEREAFSAHRLVGKSEAIRRVFKEIGAAAATRTSVLLRGERGTGKELVARAIHLASSEAEPFVVFNCSAFAREQLEGELFGHAKGATSGAGGDKVGRLRLAAGGTLFIDEIGEMPPELQAKLVGVLHEHVFEAVGDPRPQRSEARVVAATHHDLDRMVAEGAFRQDLFQRLRVAEIVLPPLRERREDVPLLVEHLLGRVTRELHSRVRYVQTELLDEMVGYAWPGNVRELENALTRGCVLAKGEVLTVDDVQLGGDWSPASSPAGASRGGPVAGSGAAGSVEGAQGAGEGELVSLREIERRHITRVLAHTKWNKRRACAILRITRPTLDRKIKEFQMARPAPTA